MSRATCSYVGVYIHAAADSYVGVYIHAAADSVMLVCIYRVRQKHLTVFEM